MRYNFPHVRRYGSSSAFLGPEATPREIVFSVLIVGVLYAVGFHVSSAIEKHVAARQLRYRQAVQIKDSGIELSHACATDVGDAFVEGDFRTVDPVLWDGLAGEHLSIRRDKERYTRHTHTVTYTDSKGKTRTRTEHYWTWDVVSTDTRRATKLTFCGNEYAIGTFGTGGIGGGRHVRNTGWHTRDVFYYQRKDFRGTVFAQLRQGEIQGHPYIYEGKDLAQTYKSFTTSYATTIFWGLWWVFIALCVFGFVMIDNKWLENRRD